MKKLKDIFETKYGHNYELCNMEEGEIPFVSRTEKNNGISSRVARTSEPPTPAGTLTVALGGSVLSTFLQPTPCYEGFHVAALVARGEMTDQEKLWYATAIRANRYKYNYGRQANKDLRHLRLPPPPDWVNKTAMPDFTKAARPNNPRLPDTTLWVMKEFPIASLGRMVKGERFRKEDMSPGDIPYIGATEYNNGVTDTCAVSPEHTLHSAGAITISYNGSIGNAFLQKKAFHAGDDINILYPSTESDAAKLYICACIRQERYRYNYGRKWHLGRMKRALLSLPSKNGSPDFEAMSAFILGCRFSTMVQT